MMMSLIESCCLKQKKMSFLSCCSPSPEIHVIAFHGHLCESRGHAPSFR